VTVPPGSAIIALFRTASALRGRVEREVLQPRGCTWLVFDVVQVVANHPTVRLHEVAAITGIPKATLATTVRRLESRGLLTRTMPARDHRQIELRATGTGDELVRQLARHVADIERQLVPDPQLRLALTAVMRRVYRPPAPPNRARDPHRAVGAPPQIR
jgi:DNA-binding MarR family transcriptional regulator